MTARVTAQLIARGFSRLPPPNAVRSVIAELAALARVKKRKAPGRKYPPAINGGVYHGKGYLTIVEHDKICRETLRRGVPPSERKEKREGVAHYWTTKRERT